MVEAAAVAEVTASDETKRNAAKYPLLRHVGTVRKNKGKSKFFIWRFVPAVQSVQYEKGMLDWYVQRNGFILWTELC